MVINHNLMAMNAQRQYNLINNQMVKATEKMSSGLKINRAADNAAGLTISEKMRWQIRGLNKADNDIQDGVSLCQVADGALGEVDSLLHRMNEISTQAANDTNTNLDRSALQAELEMIISEIDRISEMTEFNTMKVFKGKDEAVTDANGDPVHTNDIPMSAISLSSVDLGHTPFNANSGGGYMGLSAVVTDPSNPAYGSSWNLIYGNGSTSSPSVKLGYTTASGSSRVGTYNLKDITPTGYSQSGNTWTRNYRIQNSDGLDLNIKQNIAINGHDYDISYTFDNNGTVDINKLDFMFHADTAYNNNDRCEGYFINGNRVNNNKMFTTDSSFGTGSNISGSIPSSFSIIDINRTLPFSEKVTITGDAPDALTMGQYSSIRDWSYYNNVNSHLGGSTNNEDLGFTLIWKDSLSTTDGPLTHSFKYGIVSANADSNLTGVTTEQDTSEHTIHHSENEWWIQTGATQGNGVKLTIGEMDSDVLGLRGLALNNFTNSGDAMRRSQAALDKIAKQRSNIGAWQNRLETASRVARGTAENTQAAESRIRDTDMADEMLELSRSKMLNSYSTSFVAQANKSSQSVLNLLL